MARFQTETEERFAAYLDSRALEWEYETPIGGMRPDFTISWAGRSVFCEAHEPSLRLANRVGALDPYATLRQSIRKKRPQGRGAQAAGLPYVLVISELNSSIVFDEQNVPGAMFGDRTVVVPVLLNGGPAGELPKPRLVAGRRSQLQPATNTRFSAVCVVRAFTPTPPAFGRKYEAWVGPGFPPADLVVERMRARALDLERAQVKGSYDPDVRIARLLVFHNPYAAVPLPADLFAGPHDQAYGLVNDDGGYGLAAEGIRSPEVTGHRSGS